MVNSSAASPCYDAHWLLNAQPAIVALVDPSSYQILFMNEAGRQRFGEIVGQACYQKIAGYASPCAFCRMPETAQTGQRTSSEVELSDHRWVLVQWAKAVTTDGQEHVIETITDITERKRAEEQSQRLREEVEKREQELRAMHAQLLQAAKLASLGQLASGIAHELNNPLNNIALFVGNALDGLEKRALDLERITGNLIAATEQVRRAAKIITHLRSFARSTSPSERQRLSLNEVITSAVSLMKEPLRLQDVRVELVLHEPSPMIEGNGLQLEQVFVNLLTNAADAMEGVPEKILTITSTVTAELVEVQVKDTGRGILPELLPSIFDPFFTTKPVGRGTGLGLSISYGIVKAHQGRITVESLVGKGTTFLIQLPLLRGQPVAEAEQPR